MRCRVQNKAMGKMEDNRTTGFSDQKDLGKGSSGAGHNGVQGKDRAINPRPHTADFMTRPHTVVGGGG